MDYTFNKEQANYGIQSEQPESIKSAFTSEVPYYLKTNNRIVEGLRELNYDNQKPVDPVIEFAEQQHRIKQASLESEKDLTQLNPVYKRARNLLNGDGCV